MLSLSQTTGYAIQALIFLSHEKSCLIREIAKVTGIGKPYLAKIFHKLNSSGLLVAKRGYRGGILLARPAKEITLLEVVEAIEGDSWTHLCLLGMRECDSRNLCPCHDMWVEMKSRIRSSLGAITLGEVGRLAAEQTFGSCKGRHSLEGMLVGLPGLMVCKSGRKSFPCAL